jgi:hypothetical protein
MAVQYRTVTGRVEYIATTINILLMEGIRQQLPQLGHQYREGEKCVYHGWSFIE